MSQWWSWILTVYGIIGLYLIGKKLKIGWTVGILTQFLWFAYAVTTKQWGFIISAIVHIVVYFVCLERWNREEKEKRLLMKATDERLPS